jgi:hypothetical protein
MTETAADKSQTTAHSWIEPLYNENVMEKSGAPGMKKDLAGLMIHNPDGSKIIVDMYGYQGHSHMENILPELKEQSASLLNKLQGEPYFYPEEHEARRKAGLLASTEDLHTSLKDAYQSIASTDEGTKFFMENAKQLPKNPEDPNLPPKVYWVSPAPAVNPQEGWKNSELTGNVRYRTIEEQTHVILENHRGVAQQQKEATQSNYGKPDLVAQLMQEAHSGRSPGSSAMLQQMFIENGNTHLANQQINNHQAVL